MNSAISKKTSTLAMLIRKFLRLITTPGMLQCWLRWNLRLLNIVPTIILPDGSRLRGFRSFSEFWGGKDLVPTPAEVAFANQFAGRNGDVIDVGANLGSFALLCAGLRNECRVQAFEPSPTTYAALLNNLSFNHSTSILPHQLALGERSGSISFLADDANPTRNRIVWDAGDESGSVINVEVTTLDRFLEEKGISEISFLKIDVEGHEPSVLKGAAETLKNKRCAAGLVELCPANLRQFGHSVSDLIQVVESMGYELRYIFDNGSTGALVTAENAALVTLDNVALLPQAQ